MLSLLVGAGRSALTASHMRHRICPSDVGVPERKFAREIIELRETGLDHRQIASFLLDEYGIDIYPADLLSFLEDSVHVLEAIRDIAALQNRTALLANAEEHIALIER